MPLTSFSAKPRRGPKSKVVGSSVRGRADNYRGILHNVWDQLSPLLFSETKVLTEEDVVKAFEVATPGGNEFATHGSMIAELLRDPNCPKTQKGRVNFLADSVAGLGRVSARRSRDICAAERAKAKRTHAILRFEYYVVCSCGYDGHSLKHACPLCGARIRPTLFDDYA